MDEDFIHYVQVGRNGYFTFGQCAPQEPFYFDDATNISLVAPFFTNEGAQGQISYEIHSINASSSIFSQVDTLVNQHHDAKFVGKWLIVSTWKNITYTDFDSNIVRHHSIIFKYLLGILFLIFLQTNIFQGVLVTDYKRSYAVFTYYCGDLRFSGNATIGFVTGDGMFANHETSLRGNPQSIACLNSPASPWVNIVYGINSAGILLNRSS